MPRGTQWTRGNRVVTRQVAEQLEWGETWCSMMPPTPDPPGHGRAPTPSVESAAGRSLWQVASSLHDHRGGCPLKGGWCFGPPATWEPPEQKGLRSLGWLLVDSGGQCWASPHPPCLASGPSSQSWGMGCLCQQQLMYPLGSLGPGVSHVFSRTDSTKREPHREHAWVLETQSPWGDVPMAFPLGI